MANGNTSVLVGWRKILATLLMIAIPAVNGSVVGLNLKQPVDYETNTLIVWLITVLVELAPTIATLIAGSKYITANKEQNIAAMEYTDEEAAPKVTYAPVNPTTSSVSTQTVLLSETPYKASDLDAMIQVAEKQIQKDNEQVSPVSRAYYFYPMIAHFDLREVPRQYRIEESKRLVDKGLELFTEAFKFSTKLETVPTMLQSASLNTYMFELKKAVEKANNQVCSGQTFEHLRSMVTYFHELYEAQYGLKQLDGKTIDWSLYGGGSFTPTQVGWDFAKLI